MVDQSIAEMQKANQQAADQRQEQIDIAQAQYDWWAENDSIHEAEEELKKAIKQVEQGLDPEETEIASLLFEEENMKAQIGEAIDDWNTEFSGNLNLASIHDGLIGQKDSVSGAIKELKDNMNDADNFIGQTKTKVEHIDEELNIGNESLRSDVKQFNLTASEISRKLGNYAADLAKALEDSNRKNKTGGEEDGTNLGGGYRGSGFSEEELKNSIDTKYSVARQRIFQDGVDSQGYAQFYYYLDGQKVGPFVREEGAFRDMQKKKQDELKSWGFATGGLADFTGPAWLDGTPSKPELVLNATDTQNFLALRDVLSKALGSTSTVSNSYGGDATYEININVDHLNNDYDVDKVAERVKKIIVKEDDCGTESGVVVEAFVNPDGTVIESKQQEQLLG